MSRVPRLLPLVAVAVGGVLSVKALAEIDALPRMLAGARAFAADAQPKAVAKPAPKPAPAAPGAPAAPAVPPTANAAAAAPPAAGPARPLVCAPSSIQLAKDAGLSPAELQVLQSLGSRRTQLDQREQDMDTQIQLLAAAEAKLDAKLKGLNGLKADLQTLLGQTEQKEAAEIDRLVTVYSKMKPRDAAAVMATLDDRVRVPVAARMKEAALAAILSQMPTPEAKKLTENLARRYDKVQELAQNAAAPPAATPAAGAKAAPAKAAAPAKPAAAAPKPTA